MVKDRQNIRTVFLDSSVLFAAVCSPSGGSSKLFTLKNYQLATSIVALVEVERNVRKKLEDYHLERFFLLSSKLNISKDIPSKNLINKAKKSIAVKDAVILAAAKRAKADILATLDKKHFFKASVKKFIKPAKIQTPKMLIEAVSREGVVE